MPNVSSSTGRVYYLDGDANVRYLTPTGSNGFATRVPGSSQAVAMFAVSPDDRRIAVTVFDYRSKPLAVRLYIEDLTGGRNRVELPVPAGLYRWPVGWHGGNLIVGANSNTLGGWSYPTPQWGPGTSLEVLDPTSGRILAFLGNASCSLQHSLPTHAGIACWTRSWGASTARGWKVWGGVGAFDWSGNLTVYSDRYPYESASISPDGRYLFARGPNEMELISSPAAGSTIVTIGTGYSAARVWGSFPGFGGWLDSSHVVVGKRASAGLQVLDIRSQSVTDINGEIVLVGRLPGGY
jgi:hypothetical protein